MMLPAVHLIRPTIAEHLQPIARFTADVFSDGNYADQFRDNYIGNSHYDWETSRLVMDGEQIIHHWGVWGYAMRVESILLRIAGVGAVATHPQYRVQGWMHQAAAELHFELAARYRDEISELKRELRGMREAGTA